jgi:hypothetical protein
MKAAQPRGGQSHSRAVEGKSRRTSNEVFALGQISQLATLSLATTGAFVPDQTCVPRQKEVPAFAAEAVGRALPELTRGLSSALEIACRDLPTELVRAIALAELELRRIRKVRAAFGQKLVGASDVKSEEGVSLIDLLLQIERLDCYETRALTRRRDCFDKCLQVDDLTRADRMPSVLRWFTDTQGSIMFQQRLAATLRQRLLMRQLHP